MERRRSQKTFQQAKHACVSERNNNRSDSEIKQEDRPWTDDGTIIRFSVTSDGTSGKDWISRLKKKGFRISNYAKSILRSKDFKPTSGVTTDIAILDTLFTDNDRITKNIRAYAATLSFDGRKLSTPNAEIACLIREKFSDEDIEKMGSLPGSSPCMNPSRTLVAFRSCWSRTVSTTAGGSTRSGTTPTAGGRQRWVRVRRFASRRLGLECFALWSLYPGLVPIWNKAYFFDQR